jgi:O-acetyl-ADP-ribose deacetylase (regulator of RNase III)
MTDPESAPSYEDLLRDVKLLREGGLFQLRTLDVPALQRAARASGLSDSAGTDPPAIEALLRGSVEALGGDSIGEAAEYLFGLARGTVGWPAKDRRERAASYYRLTAESFRKKPERLLVGRVVEEMLRICHERRTGPAAAAAGPVGEAGETGEADQRHDEKLRTSLIHALQHVLSSRPRAGEQGSVGPGEIAAYGPFDMPFGGARAPVTVHVGPVDGLVDIDVIVSSENTCLEAAKPFKSSMSGRLRKAAAWTDASGQIVDDVVAKELAAWMREHARPGLPVETGRVAPTSSGRLVQRGVRRIYHAAVASPRTGTNDYDIDLEGIFRAVHNCIELARDERDSFDPPLRSLCFPLFGAGRGGLEPSLSFSWSWPAIHRELTLDPSWEIHLCTWRSHETAAVLQELYRTIDDRERR